MTKRHYIYLPYEDFITLDDLKNKFKVSISTIVATIFNTYSCYNQGTKLREMPEYIYKDRSKKICIKPNLIYGDAYDKALTNATYIYLHKLEQAYMDLNSEQIKVMRSYIKKIFNETKEEFYNYNHEIRIYNRLNERFKNKATE